MLNQPLQNELANTDVRLDQVIDSICDELNYLLDNKSVELDLLLDEFSTTLPITTCKTVLTNLFSHVYQHCLAGKISIVQYGTQVIIHHHSNAFNPSQYPQWSDFILGLQCTSSLCQTLHWGYYETVVTDGYQIRLQLQAAT